MNLLKHFLSSASFIPPLEAVLQKPHRWVTADDLNAPLVELDEDDENNEGSSAEADSETP